MFSASWSLHFLSVAAAPIVVFDELAEEAGIAAWSSAASKEILLFENINCKIMRNTVF